MASVGRRRLQMASELRVLLLQELGDRLAFGGGEDAIKEQHLRDVAVEVTLNERWVGGVAVATRAERELLQAQRAPRAGAFALWLPINQQLDAGGPRLAAHFDNMKAPEVVGGFQKVYGAAEAGAFHVHTIQPGRSEAGHIDAESRG